MQNDIADSTKFLCGDFRLNMWIPSDIAGKVIGKKGVVISNMQRETGCKLISACPPVGNSLWVCVTMIGEPAATTKAYSAIEKIALEVDEVVAEFALHKTKHSFLTDKGGLAVIKKVSADTNVRIFIPGPDNTSSGFMPGGMQKSNASLEGSFENVIRAFEMLEHQFKNLPAPVKSGKMKGVDPTGPDKTAPRADKEAPEKASFPAVPLVKVEKRIEVPANIVGILLARREAEKKQSVLNQIQKWTGTTVSRITAPGDARAKKTETAAEALADDELVAAAAAIAAVANECKEEAPQGDTGAGETSVATEIEASGRRRTDVSDEEDDEDDEDDVDDDDEEDDDGDDDDDEAAAAAAETEPETDTSVAEVAEILADLAVSPPRLNPSPAAEAAADAAAVIPPVPPVPFIITGYSQDNVDKAEECITRIVAGDRIKDVLSSVSAFLRGQPRRGGAPSQQPVNSRAKLMFGSKEGSGKPPKGKKGSGGKQADGAAAGAVGEAGAAVAGAVNIAGGKAKAKAKGKNKAPPGEKGSGSKGETPVVE